MDEIDGGRVVVGVVEVRADDAAEPVQPVGVAGPDERTVVDLGESLDAARRADVRPSSAGSPNPHSPRVSARSIVAPKSTSSRRDRIGARYTATVTSLILARPCAFCRHSGVS